MSTPTVTPSTNGQAALEQTARTTAQDALHTYESGRELLAWKTLVRGRADVLAHECSVLDPHAEYTTYSGLRIDQARKRAEAAGGLNGYVREIVSWFTGADQEAAWIALHEVEVCLTQHRSPSRVRADIPELEDRIRNEFPKQSDAYGRSLLRELADADKVLKNAGAHKATGNGVVSARDTVARIKELLHDRSHAGYRNKRAFRNVVFLMTLALAAATAALAIFGDMSDWMVSILRPGSGVTFLSLPGTEPFTSVWKVELVGALGGLLTAVVALQRLRMLQGPYGLQVVQAALKVPMGALTGLLGAMMLQSGLFWLDPVTGRRDFYAVVLLFGVSQQLVTRLVDARAEEITQRADPTQANP